MTNLSWKSNKLFTIVVLTITFLALGAFNYLYAEGDQVEKAKRALYEQAIKDVNLMQLAEQLRRDPGNETLRDNLLIRLSISPLDMFRVRMESQFMEYMIPRDVQELHNRWIHLRGFLEVAQSTVMALSPMSAPLVAVMASTGTNHNAASTNSPTPENYQGEVQLAVNKNNTNQMVAGANTWDSPAACGAQTQAIFYSTNGGTSWGYTCAPSVGAYGLSCPSGGIPLGSDPAVYWDNSNNVFFNYMLLCCDSSCQFGFGNPTSSLVVAKSTNSGATWSGLGVIVNNLNNASAGLDDKQFYMIDNSSTSPYSGRHYQCWDRSNNELFSYSTNSGSTWTGVDLPSAGSGLLDLGCEMAVGTNGTVHLAWDALTCGSSTCSGEASYYIRSTNGGATWSSPVLVKSHNVVSFSNSNKIPAQDERGINPFGAIDVDNTGGSYGGRLYFSYSDVAGGAQMATSDVYVARSTDNGATWSHVKVNDDTTSTAQFHPFLTVDQTNGHVVVGWQDARNDSGNKRIDYYMSRSTDGGVSWEANIKVSQPSSEFNNSTISYSDESSNNSGNNGNQYGEYLGVDAHAGKAWMAWTDTRHYFPNNTTNTQKENLGFAAVDFAGSSDTVAPTTSITAPSAGATLSGTATVSASAGDNVGVTNVEFYAGTTLIGSDGTSPYSISWDTTTITNGTYNLTSKAYDAAGNSGTSAPVSVTVTNTGSAAYDATLKAPKCTSVGSYCDSGTSLLNGRATLGPEPNYPNTINNSCADGTSGAYHSDESIDRLKVATNDSSAFAAAKAVTVTATVWCYGTTDALDLYYTANANSPSWTLIGTQNCTVSGQAATMTASYTLPTGTLQAIRGNYRYGGSQSSCSTGVYDDHDDLIFAVGSTTDTTPPTTSITSPAGGSSVSGTITISANASDNVGVTNVEFYYGTTLIGSDNTSPYSVSWNTTTVANGTYSLTSKAYDAAGNAGASSPVSVTVSNSTPDTTPPTTSITSPTNGSTVSATITISANASDNVGVTQVEFYRGTTLIGTDTTSPYSVSWNTTTVANGSYSLTSKAYDAAGNTGTSSPVSVTVSNTTSCATTTQLLSNPGFESGAGTGWTKYSSTGSTTGIITNSTSRTPHGGSWYAWLNGYGYTTTQYIYSSSTTMLISSAACSATLSFWLKIDTAETTTTTQYDKLRPQYRTKTCSTCAWSAWTTLATYSNLNKSTSYSQKSFNLTAQKGKYIQVRFYGTEDVSKQTSFLVDDTALNVTQ